jgi:hypothetical protein
VEKLGWQPEIDLRVGIERTATYFQQVLDAEAAAE